MSQVITLPRPDQATTASQYDLTPLPYHQRVLPFLQGLGEEPWQEWPCGEVTWADLTPEEHATAETVFCRLMSSLVVGVAVPTDQRTSVCQAYSQALRNIQDQCENQSNWRLLDTSLVWLDIYPVTPHRLRGANLEPQPAHKRSLDLLIECARAKDTLLWRCGDTVNLIDLLGNPKRSPKLLRLIQALAVDNLEVRLPGVALPATHQSIWSLKYEVELILLEQILLDATVKQQATGIRQWHSRYRLGHLNLPPSLSPDHE